MKKVDCGVRIRSSKLAVEAGRRPLVHTVQLSARKTNNNLLGLIEMVGTIFNKSIQILPLAGNVDIVGRTEPTIKEAYIALEVPTKEMGLVVKTN